MNKVTIKLGDLVDELSVLTIKMYLGDEQCITRHRFLTQSLPHYKITSKEIATIMRLTLVNRIIWESEANTEKLNVKRHEYIKLLNYRIEK